MADLIGRQVAIDAVIKHLQLDYVKAWGVREAINGLPPAQTEIVRCKDCKWSYDDVSGRICSHGICVDCVVTDDWFCADGGEGVK